MVGADVGAVGEGVGGILGKAGVIGNRIKEYYIGEDDKKAKIFNYIFDKLNQRYRLHLTKRNFSRSDFTVEVDADRVYDLI